MNSILKGMAISPASRKLLSVNETEAFVEPKASESVADVKTQLRQQFADELAQLRQEVITQAKAELSTKFERELLEAKTLQSTDLEKTVAGKLVNLSKAETALTQATEKLNALVEQNAKLLEAAALDIAFACISKLLGEQQFYAQALSDMVRQSLAELGGEKLIQIRVSVDDYKVLTTTASNVEFLSFITPDKNLTVGDCVINSINSSIDASMSTQLENLRAVLLAEHGRG